MLKNKSLKLQAHSKHTWSKFASDNILLLLIIFIAALLRFYKLEDNLVFSGELGHNYLAIKNFIAQRKFPLLGPPTSHPWLSFGPLFYWMFTPVLIIGKYQPIAGAYFFAVAGMLTVILNYYFVKSLMNKKVALFSTFLVSISPNFVFFTRSSRFYFLVVLLFYPFMHFLFKSIGENKKYLPVAGLFYGLMLNFHLTPIIYVPFIVFIAYFYKQNFSIKDLVKFGSGFLVPQIPFIIHNVANRFEMLIKFIIWVPYRVAGFVGVYPKNSASPQVLTENGYSFYGFVAESFTKDYFLSIVLTFMVVMISFSQLLMMIKTKKMTEMTHLVLIFVFGCLAIFVHSDPPRHYYLPLLPIPLILFPHYIIERIKMSVAWIVAIVLLISILNLQHYFSDNWFYKYEKFSREVAYSTQVKLSKSIVRNVNGKQYSLFRIGKNDHFEGDYAQNYQYLLWLYGNEPTQNSDCEVTIIEDNRGIDMYSYAEVEGIDGMLIGYNCKI